MDRLLGFRPIGRNRGGAVIAGVIDVHRRVDDHGNVLLASGGDHDREELRRADSLGVVGNQQHLKFVQSGRQLRCQLCFQFLRQYVADFMVDAKNLMGMPIRRPADETLFHRRWPIFVAQH